MVNFGKKGTIINGMNCLTFLSLTVKGKAKVIHKRAALSFMNVIKGY